MRHHGISCEYFPRPEYSGTRGAERRLWIFHGVPEPEGKYHQDPGEVFCDKGHAVPAGASGGDRGAAGAETGGCEYLYGCGACGDMCAEGLGAGMEPERLDDEEPDAGEEPGTVAAVGGTSGSDAVSGGVLRDGTRAFPSDV